MHCGNIFVWICKNGHTDVVKYLLSDEVTEKYPNINPYAQNNSGLRFVCDAKPACSYGHVGIVKYLLSDKVTDKYPCAKDNFGLCRAYKNGQINMVKYLLSNEVTDNYPKLHPKNLDKKLKIDIERLLGYSI
jgi:ankyrin repeat protein